MLRIARVIAFACGSGEAFQPVKPSSQANQVHATNLDAALGLRYHACMKSRPRVVAKRILNPTIEELLAKRVELVPWDENQEPVDAIYCCGHDRRSGTRVVKVNRDVGEHFTWRYRRHPGLNGPRWM